MMRRRTFLTTMGSGLAAAATELAVPRTGRAQPAIRIGELAAITGPIAPYGTQLKHARLMAVDEINTRGGVSIGGARHRLELVSLDGGQPGEAVKVFERLLTVEKVNLVLDGAFSSVQYALGPVIKGKNAVVVWSGGNDPDTTVGIPNAFRNTFDGGTPFMKVNEAFLRRMNVKRVATYGQRGHVEFKKFVEDYLPKAPGFEVLATEWHPFGEKDFFPVLTKLKGMKADAIFTHSVVADSVTLLKQAREIGIFPGPLWINQSANAPLMIDEESRKVMDGSYESLQTGAAHTTEAPPPSRAFFQAYAKRFGEKGFGSWAESGWDSVHIVAKAMEKAGTATDVESIATALRALGVNDVPDLLLNYQPGRIFNKDGQAHPRILITQWKDGKAVPVFGAHGV
jgi:branched-chain amino acid transport system substrate-binding protein